MATGVFTNHPDWFDLPVAVSRSLVKRKRNLHKLSVAISSFVILFGSVYVVQKVGPWTGKPPSGGLEVSYYAAISFLALLFPVTAMLFVFFNVVARREQVEDAAKRASLAQVYFPGSADHTELFERLLNLRFRESCNGAELVLFSLVTGAIAFLTLYFFLLSVAHTEALPPEFHAPSNELQMVIAGFFGAYSGSLVTILRKYRTLDVYPSTYFQAVVGLLVGIFVGLFLQTLFGGGIWSLSLVFAVGFVTAANINLLGGLLRRWMAKQTGFVIPEPNEGDLKEVIDNSEAIESLHNMSLYSITELINAEPLLVYLNLPQHIGVINGWIDEALVRYHFLPDYEAIRKAELRCFTELIAAAINWPPLSCTPTLPGELTINDNASITGDPELDKRLTARVKSILYTANHHRLLAILSRQYRQACFPTPSPQSLRIGCDEQK
jgi:hypothetical protein